MVARVFGRKARFCNTACRDGFRADRMAGAIYSARHEVGADGKRTGRYMQHEDHSMARLCCAYCDADVNGRATEDNWRR